jgi:Adenosine deaminase
VRVKMEVVGLTGGGIVEHRGSLTLAEALDRLPKVELHCHIEGTMRRESLIELAGRAGRALPTTDPRELYRYDSLDDFLRLFWLAQSCLATRDDWTRLAYESVVDGAAHGVVYRESFFTAVVVEPARDASLAAGRSGTDGLIVFWAKARDLHRLRRTRHR